MKCTIPWHVALLTRFFKPCYPVYRWAYFLYKRISDRKLCAYLQDVLAGCPNDPVILDIGANIGFFSRFFAQHAGSNARIYAFEPMPDNLDRLRREVATFPSVTVFPYAVSDREGMSKLAISPESTIDHHLSNDETDSGEEKIWVRTVAIDDICSDLPRVDIIKMDIQGAECRALRGMRKVFARSPHCVLVMELWPWGFARGGGHCQEFFDLLKELSLTARTFSGVDTLEYCRKNEQSPNSYINIVVTPQKIIHERSV